MTNAFQTAGDPQDIQADRGPNEEASAQPTTKATASHGLTGAKVFKVKPGTMKRLRACADRPGVKRLGQGTVLFAGDSALEAMSIVDATVQPLLKCDQPRDVKKIIGLMRLQRDFNRQLLDSGKALLGG